MTKEREGGTITTPNNTMKFIASCVILLLAWFGYSYMEYIKEADSKVFRISSPDGKHNITLSREVNKDGVIFLDNNGKFHYISGDGKQYQMEQLVKDEQIKPIKIETKTGSAPL